MGEELTDWHIAVLVPARNEETLLPRCLHSIERARLVLPLHVTSDVIVVSDSSVDGTYRIARQILGRKGIALKAGFSSVGAARISAARTAIERCPVSLDRCWLANTDADCEVPSTWLCDQLAIAGRGIVAVAGVVDVDSFEEHKPHVRDRFRETYLLHKDGTHPHIHGANLGIRADAYVQAGGWGALETAEDHDLWIRLRGVGYDLLSDSSLQVITSGRRIGRAPMGFASALAAHNEVLA